MKEPTTWMLILLATLLIGGCAQRATIGNTTDVPIAELERLFSGGYEAPMKMPEFTDTLSQFGCRKEWIADRDLKTERLDHAKQLLNDNPRWISILRKNNSAEAKFVRAMIKIHIPNDVTTESRPEDPAKLLKDAAKAGNPHALYWAAEQLVRQYPYYDNEPGDPKKFAEINAILEKAAMNGSGAAAYTLGLRTQTGIAEKFPSLKKIPGTDKTSAEWFQRAAELGDTEGRYAYSSYTRLSQPEANRWLEAAAKAGHDRANYDLAGNYENGTNGYPMNLDQTVRYHCRATYFGNQWSPNALKKIQHYRESAAKKTAPSVKVEGKVVFDSGRGSGKYDRMTYESYSSVVELVPSKTLEIAAIKPDTWYCNGLCFFEATITEKSGSLVAKAYWQGPSIDKPYNGFERVLTLKAGQAYRLTMKTWTTKSVGIFTAGESLAASKGPAKITIQKESQPGRGPIAFQLLR